MNGIIELILNLLLSLKLVSHLIIHEIHTLQACNRVENQNENNKLDVEEKKKIEKSLFVKLKNLNLK